MLAPLIDALFKNKEWLLEVKWEGYRILVFIFDGAIGKNKEGPDTFIQGSHK
ncbi:hypothetical protein PHSC3_001301 [Chlamydiales bacterium STE3]|nr:hypothetical protein PHSC3_001301 [Chlamydiales bacterium STE3]